jgi:hypothetical protein
MPLTDELGDLLLAYLHERFEELLLPPFRDGLFEVWLSRMAEDQPYLWPDENLEQRATFVRCTSYLADVIEERVRNSLDEAFEREWLFPWLGALHARQASLLTFNQDTLVERAIEAAGLPSWFLDEWDPPFQQPTMTWQDATGGLPGPALRGGWYGGPPRRTFRLCKLHGSTNWFWRAGDRTGATLVAWWLSGTAQGEAALPDETTARTRLLPSTTAFVVPPASTKSVFYDNPLTEQLWRQARTSLEQAADVKLVGYSLPPTDIVTSNLLRKTLVEVQSTQQTPVTVVNPNPEDVCSHLRAMGVADERLNSIGSVAEYAQTYVESAARGLLLAFRTHVQGQTEPAEPLLVGFSIRDARPVVSITVRDDDHVIELGLEPVPPGQPATSVHLREGITRVTVGDLAGVLEATIGLEWRLQAVGPTGLRSDVVAAASYSSGMAGSSTTWQVLRTTTKIDEVDEPPRVDLSALTPETF